ncbi:type II toxin-antitoxin system PemK/MazF family toxin [Demequina sp. SYSU T00192]|uniref:mRNA interferase n=1 Tax=Demequina litoralis TaxID=3051660 RepID=A0ABT8GCI6_9MICO|nr:type II toxin-antitoxin system PemK/MazF family toxin [Demequina sp. SYSU T00192]MDN4476853.1 type II toxin-antitoxin system PemK/MazF family toxin [Demequina sp. SYSU T00192]
MIARGDVVWVDFGVPRGSEPAKRRPAVVVQADWLLATAAATVLVVPLTSNIGLEAFPGNVRVPQEASGLDRDAVAVVSQVGPVGRELIDPFPVGHVPIHLMRELGEGVRLTLDV